MAEENVKVTVVLVNYNGKKFLKNCIESIKAQTYKNTSLLIVDNDSSDGSVGFIKALYPEIPVITCTQNFGFAKGNNIGITCALKAKAEYVLLLNVDTVIDKHLVEYLIKDADSYTVTVPKIYMDKRMMKIGYAGGKIDYVNGRSFHYGHKDNNDTKEVSFACGCCALIHRSIFNRIGLFDESYYLYFEDTDFSARLKKNNIKIRYVEEARMWHKSGGSSGPKGKLIISYYLIRNRLYFINKFQDEIQIKPHQVAWEVFREHILQGKERERRKYIWWGIIDYYAGNMYKLKHEARSGQDIYKALAGCVSSIFGGRKS